MNVKRLIDSGLVVIQGFKHAAWVCKDAAAFGKDVSTPNYTGQGKGPVQKRMFAIAFNEPQDGGYLVTNLVFDMSSAYGFRYWSEKKMTEPWERRRSANRETIQKISDEEVEEIKNDSDLIKLIEDWAEDMAPIALRKLSRVNFGQNNSMVENMKINENQKVTLTIGQLKKLVKESRNHGVKGFGEVEVGDIVHRDGYDTTLFVVIDKGEARKMAKFDTTGSIANSIDLGYIDDNEPCVLIQSFETGFESVWVYGDGGVVSEWEMGNIKNITKL